MLIFILCILIEIVVLVLIVAIAAWGVIRTCGKIKLEKNKKPEEVKKKEGLIKFHWEKFELVPCSGGSQDKVTNKKPSIKMLGEGHANTIGDKAPLGEPKGNRNKGVKIRPSKKNKKRERRGTKDQEEIEEKKTSKKFPLIDSDHEDLQEIREKELNGGVGYTRDLKVIFTAKLMSKWSNKPTKTKKARRFFPIECKVYEKGTKEGKKTLEDKVPKK